MPQQLFGVEMCSHYQSLKDAEQLLKKVGVTRPAALGKYDMWPRYQGMFVRRPLEHDSGDEAVADVEAVTGRWGGDLGIGPAGRPGGGREAVHIQRPR